MEDIAREEELEKLIDQAVVLTVALRSLQGVEINERMLRVALESRRDRILRKGPGMLERVTAKMRGKLQEMEREIEILAQAPAGAPEQQLQQEGMEAQPEAVEVVPMEDKINVKMTPAGKLMQTINSSLQWNDDSRCPRKAYIFACLSELAYLHMSKFELPGKDRYRVIPSLALEKVLERGIAIEMRRMLGRLDIEVAIIDTESFVFFLFKFNRFTVIAVRGTMKVLADWIIDLDARKVSLNQQGYHLGFYRDAKNALPELTKSCPSGGTPIYFTGHSLGGAIAGILPQLWPAPATLMTPYTFASPRFGNRAVAKSGNVYAYVRALDPVPHLPFQPMGFYSSGWPPVVIPKGDVWLSSSQLFRQWRKLLPAHSMEQYRKLMGEACRADYFPVEVYYEALTEALTDSPR